MQLAQAPTPAINFGTIKGGIPNFKFGSSTTGEIITQLLPYLFAAAGFALLIYLIYGGFQLMTSSGNPDKTKAAGEILTHAVIGFVIIFIAYWLVQLVGIVFGITDVKNIFK